MNSGIVFLPVASVSDWYKTTDAAVAVEPAVINVLDTYHRPKVETSVPPAKRPSACHVWRCFAKTLYSGGKLMPLQIEVFSNCNDAFVVWRSSEPIVDSY